MFWRFFLREMKTFDYEANFCRGEECFDSMGVRGLSLLEQLGKLDGSINRDLRLNKAQWELLAPGGFQWRQTIGFQHALRGKSFETLEAA